MAARLAAGRVPRSSTKACQRVLPTPQLPHSYGSLHREQGSQPAALHNFPGAPSLGQLSPPAGREPGAGNPGCAPATGCLCTRTRGLATSGGLYWRGAKESASKEDKELLGTAPALAGKLRHALEGMGVPLEDNQRFQVSPTSFYLQRQRRQKLVPHPLLHTRASAHAGHLDGSLLMAPRELHHWGRGFWAAGEFPNPRCSPEQGSERQRWRDLTS